MPTTVLPARNWEASSGVGQRTLITGADCSSLGLCHDLGTCALIGRIGDASSNVSAPDCTRKVYRAFKFFTRLWGRGYPRFSRRVSLGTPINMFTPRWVSVVLLTDPSLHEEFLSKI